LRSAKVMAALGEHALDLVEALGALLGRAIGLHCRRVYGGAGSPSREAEEAPSGFEPLYEALQASA
jgi:hypothetical protein